MSTPTLALAGKTVIVTGASRGIGRAIALGYAHAGAAVGCAARNSAELKRTVVEIEQSGGKALAVPTDVTQEAQVEAMMRKVNRRFGDIHVLVINAGAYLDRGNVATSATADWRATFDLNLFGAYFCARAAIPYLRKSGSGKIITVGSGLGHHGRAGGAAYACSKAALWMLTRILAQELAEDNISVNELIPGPVQTGAKPARKGKKIGTGLGKNEWLKEPDDVVPLALFLATQPNVGPTAQSFSLMRRDG